MSRDSIDNELSHLYQQRKSHVIAPDINLEELPKTRRLSVMSVLAIFSLGSITSFGIMAIINFLSDTPVVNTPVYNTNHHVDVTQKPPADEIASVLVAQKPFPPKPVINEQRKSDLIAVDKLPSGELVKPMLLVTAQIKLATLPRLKEPELAIQPIYKELPKYAPNALYGSQKNQRTGEIQLRYQITPQGKVDNISIVQSSVNRALEQSAKKALAKWQYEPNGRYKETYEIIFEFSVKEN